MSSLFFAYPNNEALCEKIRINNGGEAGFCFWGSFPDTESKIKLNSEVVNRHVVLVCSLNKPDIKLTHLYFFSQLLRDHGAKKITLVSPYLPYMRQDKIFTQGEGITAKYCARLISLIADELYTLDPHLHRISNLKEIYTIPTFTLHAALNLSVWIAKHVKDAVLIGPDSESEQWVSQVARKTGCEYTVLEKIRSGDREVKVKMKNEGLLSGKTPILVDDIISTGRTMIETLEQLRKLKTNNAICVVVHAVFAEQSYEQLLAAGAEKIISTNSILHVSNEIDVSDLFKIPVV